MSLCHEGQSWIVTFCCHPCFHPQEGNLSKPRTRNVELYYRTAATLPEEVTLYLTMYRVGTFWLFQSMGMGARVCIVHVKQSAFRIQQIVCPCKSSSTTRRQKAHCTRFCRKFFSHTHGQNLVDEMDFDSSAQPTQLPKTTDISYFSPFLIFSIWSVVCGNQRKTYRWFKFSPSICSNTHRTQHNRSRLKTRLKRRFCCKRYQNNDGENHPPVRKEMDPGFN